MRLDDLGGRTQPAATRFWRREQGATGRCAVAQQRQRPSHWAHNSRLGHLVVLAFIGLFSFINPASAEPYTFQKAGLQLEVPTGWSVELNPDGTGLTISPPDGGAMLMFQALPPGQLSTALREVDTLLSTLVTERVVGPPEPLQIAGMNGVMADGHGKLDGKPIGLGLIVVRTPEGVLVFFLGLLGSENAAKYEFGVTQVLAGMRPIATKPPTQKSRGK